MSRQFSRALMLVGAVAALCFISRFVLSATRDGTSPTFVPADVSARHLLARSAQAAASPDEAAAPAVEQSYVGSNQCFICHRPQTATWTETKHAQAFTNIPEKYRTDPACLRCHVTGYGEEGGYVAGTDKDLLHVGCESCHGPGARHIDAAQRFVFATPDEEERIEREMRESIVKTPTDSVCAACHITQAHQNHPPYEGQPSRHIGSATVVQCEPMWPDEPRAARAAAPVRYSPGYSVKTCGSCHYDQYTQWRTERHSALSAMLPARYLTDPDCQQCHPKADTSAERATANIDLHHQQIGVACESCHGPAREHVRFNVQFISRPVLGPQLEEAARQSIREGKPAATCIQCHLGESHRQHPEFDEQ